MDPKLQTSFIPKKPFTAEEKKQTSSNILILFCSILFVATLLIAGGIFLYDRVLDQQITSAGKSLDLAQGQFNPDTIQEIADLDGRIESAKQILASHTLLTPLFQALEKTILKTVRFQSMNFAITNNPNLVSLSLKGQAVSYGAVAFQSDVISHNRYFINPIFSNLDLDQSGNVIFSFNSAIDPALLLYSNNLNNTSGTESSNASF